MSFRKYDVMNTPFAAKVLLLLFTVIVSTMSVPHISSAQDELIQECAAEESQLDDAEEALDLARVQRSNAQQPLDRLEIMLSLAENRRDYIDTTFSFENIAEEFITDQIIKKIFRFCRANLWGILACELIEACVDAVEDPIECTVSDLTVTYLQPIYQAWKGSNILTKEYTEQYVFQIVETHRQAALIEAEAATALNQAREQYYDCLAEIDPDLPICANSLQSRLVNSFDAQGQVIQPIEIRLSPFVDSQVISQVATGESFFILNGPECQGGFTWWEIALDQQLSGWVPESSSGTYNLAPFVNDIAQDMIDTVVSHCLDNFPPEDLMSLSECYQLIIDNCLISQNQLNMTCADGVISLVEPRITTDNFTNFYVPASGTWLYTWEYSVGICPDGSEVVSQSFNAPFEVEVIISVADDNNSFNLWFVDGASVETPIVFTRIEDGVYEATAQTLLSAPMHGEFQYTANVLFSNEIDLTEFSPFPLIGGSDPENPILCRRQSPVRMTLFSME